jgi:putative transposase
VLRPYSSVMMREQQELRFPNTWGGARPGAGRPRLKKRKSIAHRARPPVSRHKPHHVTVRVTKGTWNLRSQHCFRPIAEAMRLGAVRKHLRIVHFSVQHNHIHLIVEANSRRAMSNGLRVLFARVARGLNDVMQATGTRLADRYHEHILETPSETRNALLYVIGNRGVHLLRRGKRPSDDFDPFSSLVRDEIIQPPECWLLQKGWLGPPGG